MTALQVHPRVREALDRGRPVVALESTVIAHGLPPPHNIETALGMEQAVRAAGATPATIAILDGRLRVGLAPAEIERLASARQVLKCSRRDLAPALARGADGATTVAATMYVARMAGISVFATGGIGGVHRGHPHDVSADLMELAQTPVAVVCAGAKAILDLPLTLEVLETHGVPVVGLGTDEFPAFYSTSSGLPVDVRCDTARDVARIFRTQRELGLPNGLLVALPPPPDAAMPRDDVEAAIVRALDEAEAAGIAGKNVTPFLLARVGELTRGRSRETNMALLLNNAKAAAEIAAALLAPA